MICLLLVLTIPLFVHHFSVVYCIQAILTRYLFLDGNIFTKNCEDEKICNRRGNRTKTIDIKLDCGVIFSFKIVIKIVVLDAINLA